VNGARVPQRIAAAIGGVIFGAYALFILRQLVQNFSRFGFEVLSLLLMLYGGFGAVLCWWFALRGHLPPSRRHIHTTIRGGWIIGAVGFVIGFIGPIVLTPQSNQGPLLGIFVTGPIGFIVGAIGGWVYGWNRPREVEIS
jgi:hypothetical protein